MSRANEKLLLLFQLCSRLREAFGKPSGWVRDGFGICEYGSLCYSPKQVPIKSQLSPIIFLQSCELDGRRMGDEGEGEKKSKWKNVNLRLSFRHRLRKKRQYFNI